MKQFTWYSYEPVLSRGGFYNFIVGGRGVGKTYGAKRLAIKAYLRDGSQFIYIRRRVAELDKRASFFADIKHEFPDYAFRVEGLEGQICRDPKAAKKTWETICYFEALSTSHKRKSTPYPKVKFIIYDEFVIDKANTQYLKNEFTMFNDFYNTVDRFQDRVKVFFLGNAVTIDNPYFLELGIRPIQEFSKSHDGYVVVNIVDSKEYANEVMNSKFGRFIASTSYADYAVGNEFHDNHNKLIEDKPGTARYTFTIETPSGGFSIWHDAKTSKIYCHRSRPKLENIGVMTPQQMREGVVLLGRGDDLVKGVVNAYRRDRVRFDRPQTRNRFQEMMKSYG